MALASIAEASAVGTRHPGRIPILVSVRPQHTRDCYGDIRRI
jgi:hypothetical protein